MSDKTIVGVALIPMSDRFVPKRIRIAFDVSGWWPGGPRGQKRGQGGLMKRRCYLCRLIGDLFGSDVIVFRETPRVMIRLETSQVIGCN